MNLVTNQYEIIYDKNEFPTHYGMMNVANGDCYIYNGTPINILGYGVEEGNHTLKIFFIFDDDVFSYDIFEFSEILLKEETSLKLFIDSENNTYYNDRVDILYDTTILMNILNDMDGILIRDSGCPATIKKYRLNESQIGNPDWIIKFRSMTNGGQYSLSKISTLTREHIGKVFLHCFSNRDTDEFSDSNSTFFALMGVGISPMQCVASLSKLI